VPSGSFRLPPSVIESGTTASRLEPESEWLRATVGWEKPLGVDRESHVIRGLVAAELGSFKSEGRGQFDSESLDKIVELANAHPAGLKWRYTHPGLSSDGLGSVLGRGKNWRRDGTKVRYDGHLNPTAMKPRPGGGGTPLGTYIEDLAESDAGLFGSSLVLTTEKIYRRDENGNPVKDAAGKEIPPVWRPKQLRAIDAVDEGDAVHGDALSVDGLADENVRQAAAALDAQFSDCDRAAVEARATAFLSRYLNLRFGDADPEESEMPKETEILNAGTTTPPKPADPKPPASPTPPAPKPGEPGGPAVPTQPREHHGLSADELKAQIDAHLATKFAELDAKADELQKREDARVASARRQAETEKRLSIDKWMELQASLGRITVAERDIKPADEGWPLSLRAELYDLSADPTVEVAGEKLSKLDLRMKKIEQQPVRQNGGQQLKGGTPAEDGTDAESLKKLRAHYPLLAGAN
jgi:hypothetical protein